jgi:hypothetical protein
MHSCDKASENDAWKEFYVKKIETFNFPATDEEIDKATAASKVKI